MRRYLTDCPDILMRLKPREQRHHTLTKLNELIAYHPAFIIIADEIKQITNGKIFAYGSRVNGNYYDNSDYDVAVICDKKFRNKLISKKFDFRVDLHFINEPKGNMIEILL